VNHFEPIQELIASTLGIEKQRITSATTQAEVPEWDSVSHLNLMIAFEDTFRLKLTVSDMQHLNSVPAMRLFLEEHGL
jgi:acyl carrier protein